MQKENAVIKQRRHPELDSGSSTHDVSQRQQQAWKIPYQVRDDNTNFTGVGPVFARPARTGAPLRSGFTLIELLVVVLIIGILAAVALPQYNKAVEKSRAIQALTLLKSVSEAADAYYLANGVWPKNFDELSLDIPWTGRERTYTGSTQDTRSNGTWSIQIYWDSNNVSTILAERLDGKFAGAGFSIEKQNDNDPASHSLVGLYLCNEYLQGDKPFTASAGSFCKNIMGATLYKTFSWGRYYQLPW